jgi:hypothetical protein
MQQVGGALGLATLSTVAVHFTSDKVTALSTAAQSAAGAGSSPEKAAQLQTLIGNVAFTEGATHAFLTGAGMIWLGTMIVLLFLNVKHEELATEEPPVGVH